MPYPNPYSSSGWSYTLDEIEAMNANAIVNEIQRRVALNNDVAYGPVNPRTSNRSSLRPRTTEPHQTPAPQPARLESVPRPSPQNPAHAGPSRSAPVGEDRVLAREWDEKIPDAFLYLKTPDIGNPRRRIDNSKTYFMPPRQIRINIRVGDSLAWNEIWTPDVSLRDLVDGFTSSGVQQQTVLKRVRWDDRQRQRETLIPPQIWNSEMVGDLAQERGEAGVHLAVYE